MLALGSGTPEEKRLEQLAELIADQGAILNDLQFPLKAIKVETEGVPRNGLPVVTGARVEQAQERRKFDSRKMVTKVQTTSYSSVYAQAAVDRRIWFRWSRLGC